MSYEEVLKEKRAEVLAEIDGLRTQATELAGRIAAKEGQLRNLDDLLAIEAGATDGWANDGSPARVAPTKSQRFTDAAAEILAETGAPIHYVELTRRLGERGVYVPGKDPGANLIAHMLRDQRFSRVQGRGMYGLAEWPRPTTSAPPRTRRRQTARPRTTRRRGPVNG